MIEVLLLQRLLLVPVGVPAFGLALADAELAGAVGLVGKYGDGVLLVEGAHELQPELLLRKAIRGQESHEVEEVILREDSVIDALEL